MQINEHILTVEHEGNAVDVALPHMAVDSDVKVYAVPQDYRADGIFAAVITPGAAEEVPACDPALVRYLGVLPYPAAAHAQLAVAKQLKLQQVNDACDAAVGALTATYPQAEIQSWPQQVKEADAFAADGAAEVPLLAMIAAQRGLNVAQLVQRVHAKVAAYAHASGYLIGRRQALEDAIDAAAALQDLEAVVWTV